MAAAFVGLLERRRDDFELAHAPPFVNVCFWYTPIGLRATPAYARDRDRVLKALTERVHAAIVCEGDVLVRARRWANPSAQVGSPP